MKNIGEIGKFFRTGAFYRRVGWIFALQIFVVSVVCIMAFLHVAPWFVAVAVMMITSLASWFAVRREWQQISMLAHLVKEWQHNPDIDGLRPEGLVRSTDADVASLAYALHNFASRVVTASQRERNFTRDASHELRSPLTVIKMSGDMLADEASLSEFGLRSVRRLRRATAELESLVEALLLLARDVEPVAEEHFVVNEVLEKVVNTAQGLIKGRAIELHLEQPARFVLDGSPRAFSLLCWQVMRNACQQVEQGSVVITVMAGVISVSNHTTSLPPPEGSGPIRMRGVDRHGFELAIAQRLSERFAWPLELLSEPGRENVARIHFPNAVVLDAAAAEA